MKFIKSIILVSLITFFNSCASGYRTINPNSLHYSTKIEESGIQLEYKYNVLKKKKYSKKEIKTNIKLVAVKITNNTNRTLTFDREIKLVNSKGVYYTILSKEAVYSNLKQKTASYLWYLLLTPLQFQKTENGSTSSTPIGIFIGPGIAGGNMLVSSSANTKFENELKFNDLNGKNIKPGQTVTGLVGIFSSGYDFIKLSVELTKDELEKSKNVVFH